MNNKQQIQKLRDNAELAMASYGYFHLLKDNKGTPRKRYVLDKQGNKIADNSYSRGYKEVEITCVDVLNLKLKGQEVLINQVASDKWLSSLSNQLDDAFNFDKLKGDFSPIQAQRFFERYDLLIHQPNTESGFSATLFGEKRKQIDTKTKKVSYTNKYGYINYIFAIRGTELKINQAWQDIITADGSLVLDTIPQGQYDDMLRFYNFT